MSHIQKKPGLYIFTLAQSVAVLAILLIIVHSEYSHQAGMFFTLYPFFSGDRLFGGRVFL